MNLQRCRKDHPDCFARCGDNNIRCDALADTRFRGECPFYKPKQEERVTDHSDFILLPFAD